MVIGFLLDRLAALPMAFQIDKRRKCLTTFETKYLVNVRRGIVQMVFKKPLGHERLATLLTVGMIVDKVPKLFV